MQVLNIQITKARISGFSVDLGETEPKVSATIKLLTEGGKEITSYSISSHHWQDNLKISVSPEMVGTIIRMADQLEKIVAEHCQSTALQLAHIQEVVSPTEVPF